MSVEGSTVVITGTLGGGKSLAASGFILEHIRKGGTVVTNIPLFLDKIAAWLGAEWSLVFDPSRLVMLLQSSIADFQNVAKRGNADMTCLMVLDEAALDLGARSWQQQSDEQFNFVILCRKLRIDLVLIAQDANDVDKRIRQKMQTEVHCRSLMNVPILSGFVRLPIFIQVSYTIELGKKPWRTGAKWFWKGAGWGMFDSHALHGAKAELYAALEVAALGKLEAVKRDWSWAYAVVSCACIAAAVVVIL